MREKHLIDDLASSCIKEKSNYTRSWVGVFFWSAVANFSQFKTHSNGKSRVIPEPCAPVSLASCTFSQSLSPEELYDNTHPPSFSSSKNNNIILFAYLPVIWYILTFICRVASTFPFSPSLKVHTENRENKQQSIYSTACLGDHIFSSISRTWLTDRDTVPSPSHVFLYRNTQIHHTNNIHTCGKN